MPAPNIIYALCFIYAPLPDATPARKWTSGGTVTNTLVRDQVDQPVDTIRIPVIDTDVHQSVSVTDEQLLEHLEPRWRDYLNLIGVRRMGTERGIPPQREFTHRLDSIDPSGRPAVLPEFTRQQLLDEYDMSAAVLSNAYGITMTRGGGNFPEQLSFALARAFNDTHRDVWMKADPRFHVAMHLPIEHPAESVREIERCKSGEYGDRFAAVVLEPRSEYAIGSPKYWPVFEAMEHYDTAPGRRMSPSGGINYYFEWHCGFPMRNYPLTSSLIFEGVFEQFPKLRVSLIEQSWAWAAPFAWRLDSSWKLLRDEVPHLKRAPSEYFREHFYFTTQPMEEPDPLEEYATVLGQFEDHFGPDHLMFSSDYPHWDFDSPYESVPPYLPDAQRRRILGENAGAFYNIPLLEGTGILADGAPARNSA
jgi:predicted TIM-barrel fold metal-dependent hydrolase